MQSRLSLAKPNSEALVEAVESNPVFSLTLESSLESVDLAEQSTLRYTEAVGFEEADRYFIGLAVREIVVNAIKHGNHFDLARKALLRLSMNGAELIIEVTDEGDGFRLEDVPDPGLPENRERRSGRGVTIAIGLMDEFVVDRNMPHGTHIRMMKRLPTRTLLETLP